MEAFLSAAIENTLAIGKEIIADANEIAPIGRVKTTEYGTLSAMLTQETLFNDLKGLETKELAQASELSGNSIYPIKSVEGKKLEESIYLNMKPQEIAKDIAESLCDHGITWERWQKANFEGKKELLISSAHIMAKEMRLPDKWVKNMAIGIKDMKEKDGTITMAYAEYCFYTNPNGSVSAAKIPSITINSRQLNADFFEMMSTLYHEMIHVKQYASIDGLIPTERTDFRLLDLIRDVRDNSVGNSSRVNYLSSAFEAEAWAQGLYFKEMLKAVVSEYG